MTKVAALIKELEHIPDPLLDEVIDFVQFVKQKHAEAIENALLSEKSLAEHWLSTEEDEAWQDL
ncbi:MAG: hypothetical protein KC422_25280 [Trueperaceae bacterium]|nr:hypothetical protein [Trueperaceae bacterium]